MRWTLLLPPALSLQSVHAAWPGGQIKVGALSWAGAQGDKDDWSPGPRPREERAARRENFREVLKFLWGFSWVLVSTCTGRSPPKWRKNHPKGSKFRAPHTVPVRTSQNQKPHNLQDTVKEYQSQMYRLVNPTVSTALLLTNRKRARPQMTHFQVTAFQNRAQEYLEEYKNIWHPSRLKKKNHNLWYSKLSGIWRSKFDPELT